MIPDAAYRLMCRWIYAPPSGSCLVDDVDRHKQYHGSPRVDKTKQAGFTMKWIAKLRPIQFDCDDAEITRELLYINEIFAVRAGLAFMKRSPDQVPEDIYADLLYTLHYRHIDERMLFIWLATLDALGARARA